MRILITTAETPFVEGGGELHARRLRQVLRDHGHQVELFAFPMVKQLPRQIESEIDYCQQLHVETLGGERIDRVIGLNIVPHTQERTVIQHYSKGSQVNLDVDLVARYLETLLLNMDDSARSRLNMDMLARAGFVR